MKKIKIIVWYTDKLKTFIGPQVTQVFRFITVLIYFFSIYFIKLLSRNGGIWKCLSILDLIYFR